MGSCCNPIQFDKGPPVRQASSIKQGRVTLASDCQASPKLPSVSSISGPSASHLLPISFPSVPHLTLDYLNVTAHLTDLQSPALLTPPCHANSTISPFSFPCQIGIRCYLPSRLHTLLATYHMHLLSFVVRPVRATRRVTLVTIVGWPDGSVGLLHGFLF